MVKISIRTFMFSFLLLMSGQAAAQGLVRSSGIGLRIGFWNVTNHPTAINSSFYGQQATVDIGGAGASIYFFSRAHENWFLEMSFGAVGGAHEEHTIWGTQSTEISAVVPLLFGVRYDLLTTRFPSALQPYLSVGGGPYWTTSIKGESTGLEATLESSSRWGAYAGGGVNLVLASWFALNFDTKYHFVDFQFEKDYSGLEFAFGFNVMWGQKREIFQIKDIKLVVTDIYPAYYQFYNTYPLALVSVKNVAGYPIDVKIRSSIKHYSERVKESPSYHIDRGKTQDIPVTAIFGNSLLNAEQREPAVLDISIEARAGRTLTREISAHIMVHNRNAWNGDMDKLGLFVTPDNPEILDFSRAAIQSHLFDNLAGSGNFQKAQLIFDALQSHDIRYISDPNILFYKDDRVQYATETLHLRHGDCDDLVVLYASLLESLGIKTAFIEVKNPQQDIAHLYLMFDSGMEPAQAHVISSNEKRFIVRERASGKSTVWIPVETTLIQQGFEQAWKTGATNYLKEGMVENGLEQGWVRIIDIE
ncbi:MAG: outer membrane beta-barrel protein [Candidatus Zhuqueibacterota bacterium]